MTLRRRLRGRNCTCPLGPLESGVNSPSVVPRGATPRVQDTHRRICFNEGTLPSRESTPAVQGGPTYNRGRGQGGKREGGDQTGSSTPPERRYTRETAQQQAPAAERVASIKRQITATGEYFEGRVFTRIGERTLPNCRGGITWGRSREQGHFYEGQPSEGTAPPLAAARLLPSEPNPRTILTPPPTFDEPPGEMPLLQSNRPAPLVTPFPSRSSLVLPYLK